MSTDLSQFRYEFKTLQAKWKPRWRQEELYRTGQDSSKPKFYCLDFFPYPSGSGLSVGHLRNYVPTDVISRLKRMQGFNVLHPMGWDAFGLPAENFALKMGVHPALTTEQNVTNYKRQLALAETSYDWDKELNSSSVEYYRWTQWFFLLLHERGLAYQAEGYQWFCEECGTVLANEQVENGLCWRHEKPVSKRKLKQWYFRITAYAERLLDDLATVDWPEHIKLMQKNWIGKSTGTEARFQAELPGTGELIDLPIFTTRIDTVFGVTYMVLAPESPLVERLVTPAQKAAVEAYVAESRQKSEIERTSTEREKTGVALGSFAINPLSGARIPIWTADYVLAHYGTGIVMAVPAHDTRDYAFAKKFGLPIRTVILPPSGEAPAGEAYTDPGTMTGSGKYDGLPSEQAIERLNADLETAGIGKKTIQYKFRDWLISRQRYWGAPIPIVHCPACGAVPVPADQLPVRLPELTEFRPSGTGKGPLATVPEFVNTACPKCSGPAQRETDTMDGFACSSWYFLRYPDPRDSTRAFSPETAKYWLPVDLYVGGAEHAVMHLLYARFWTKVMFDAGLTHFHEPFQRLRNQGMVLGADGQKMSKSKGNVVTPDDVVERHGPDTLRGYLLFLGSFESEVAWSDEAISGLSRYHYRVWDLVTGRRAPTSGAVEPARVESTLRELNRRRHCAVKKVTQDLESFSFNTAVAALMEYTNAMIDAAEVPGVTGTPGWEQAIETLLVLLAPISPFITEELWELTGRRAASGSIHRQSWPVWDEASLAADRITYPVQINGKIRDRVEVAAGIAEADLKEAVLQRELVRKNLEGKQVTKFIVVPGRLVSIAAK
jgi:leucyl-tRNA synthetase